MYKLVAIDLDETLFNDQNEVCLRNKEAIRKARNAGVKIVPCSGRTPGFLGNLLGDLEIDKRNEYSILGNGSIIVDNEKNDVLYCEPVPFEKCVELFEFGCKHDICIQLFTPDCVYFFFADEEEKAMGKKFGKNIIFKEDYDISFLKDEIIVKMIYEKVDMPYLHSLVEALKPITDGSITISFSSNRYLELNRMGINKGNGLLHLATLLNIDIKDTIGIGDNYNDLQLIEDAGLGVAVRNAKDIIKEAADYICISDNNEGAVGEVIEKFILKEEK